MGIGPGSRSSSQLPRREWYPSGPWINGVRPDEVTAPEPKVRKRKDKPPAGNPNPSNYKIVGADERHGYLVVKIQYPDCSNYEGNKILVFKGTLIELVNQKWIDPHFFEANPDFKSPLARFVPTDEGWEMALLLIEALHRRGKK